MSKRMMQMLAVIIVIIAILGFVKFQQIQAAIAMGKSFAPPPDAVTTVIAKPVQWQITMSAVGDVAPVQGVTLSADQPGVVDKIGFESGAHVHAGDMLVQLDVRQERAQLAAAEAQRDLAKTNFDRAAKLLQQQLVAQSEYDAASATFKQAEASVSELRATVDRKTIRAPFSGTAGIREVNLGQYVHSGDPIVPLQAAEQVFVNFSVPQQQVSDLRVGAMVRASADSGSAAIATGRITAINPVVDESTRNVQVQATFPNAHGLLRPGAYVTVQAVTGSRPGVIAVPASAINFAPYGNSVFIVEKMKGPDGKEYQGVRQQFVKLGQAQGDQVAILAGLKAGEEVVTSGVFKLRQGGAVKVNNTSQPENSLAPKPVNS